MVWKEKIHNPNKFTLMHGLHYMSIAKNTLNIEVTSTDIYIFGHNITYKV